MQDTLMRCCAPGVFWVVEKNGIRLFGGQPGQTLFLSYPEAALWDLITQEYSFLRAEMVLTHTFSFPPGETAHFMAHWLERLTQDGYLQKTGHG
jgi:hypothetical protein